MNNIQWGNRTKVHYSEYHYTREGSTRIRLTIQALLFSLVLKMDSENDLIDNIYICIYHVLVHPLCTFRSRYCPNPNGLRAIVVLIISFVTKQSYFVAPGSI
jgi:hypothetical protein